MRLDCMLAAMAQNVYFFWRCSGSQSLPPTPQPIDDNRHTKNARVLSGVQISSPCFVPNLRWRGMRMQERTGSKAQRGSRWKHRGNLATWPLTLSLSCEHSSSYTNHGTLFIPFCPCFRPSLHLLFLLTHPCHESDVLPLSHRMV